MYGVWLTSVASNELQLQLHVTYIIAQPPATTRPANYTTATPTATTAATGTATNY